MLQIFWAFVVEITDDSKDDNETKGFLVAQTDVEASFDKNIKGSHRPDSDKVATFPTAGFFNKHERWGA